MIKYFIITVIIFSYSNLFSQCMSTRTTHGPDSNTPLLGNAPSDVLQESKTGKVFRVSSNQSYSGSQFLFDEWKAGVVILNTGIEYKNVMLKFDAVNNKFYFNRNDSIFELPEDAAEVNIKSENEIDNDITFRRIMNGNNKLQKGMFVQVLSDGKISLFKLYCKRIEGENTNNGIFKTEKTVVQHNSLWAAFDDKIIAVRLNPKSLEELTPDKLTAIQNYVKTKKLNLKNESDFASAIEFYNTYKNTTFSK